MISLHAFLMGIRGYLIHRCSYSVPYLCFAAQDIYGDPGKRAMEQLLRETYPDGYRIAEYENYGACPCIEILQFCDKAGKFPPYGWRPDSNYMKCRMDFIERILNEPDRMITLRMNYFR